MKIILEDVDSQELEVTIKGNLADDKVQQIITLLKSNSITSHLILFDENREVLTKIRDICYFEVVDRKTIAVTSSDQFLCKYTLTELVGLLKQQGIVQIGKSLLVNVHHVKSLEAEFSGNYVTLLHQGTKLIISRFYMKEFRSVLKEVTL